MAGIKNEVQTIREYNAYFRTDLFVSMHCTASFITETVGTEVCFYHSSGRALVECLQKQCILYKKIVNFTNLLQEFKINVTNVII